MEMLKVSKDHYDSLKKLIKQLQKLCKIRLRVDNGDSIQILKDLNEKMLTFSEINNKMENGYQNFSRYSKHASENEEQAKKYEELKERVLQIETNYREKLREQSGAIEDLEMQLNQYKNALANSERKIEEGRPVLAELQMENDNLKNDMRLKEGQINRLKIEKENIKKQTSNLNSLLRQVNEEQDVESKKSHSQVQEKIKLLRDELNQVKDSYSRKIGERDLKIQKLERENVLLRKQADLNKDFTFLQSSVNKSNYIAESKLGSPYQMEDSNEILGFSSSGFEEMEGSAKKKQKAAVGSHNSEQQIKSSKKDQNNNANNYHSQQSRNNDQLPKHFSPNQ